MPLEFEAQRRNANAPKPGHRRVAVCARQTVALKSGGKKFENLCAFAPLR
jgi:hypothetical protein